MAACAVMYLSAPASTASTIIATPVTRCALDQSLERAMTTGPTAMPTASAYRCQGKHSFFAALSKSIVTDGAAARMHCCSAMDRASRATFVHARSAAMNTQMRVMCRASRHESARNEPSARLNGAMPSPVTTHERTE